MPTCGQFVDLSPTNERSAFTTRNFHSPASPYRLELAILRVDLRFFFGTFAPARRASDRPMAIACFLLLTFFPDRPLRSVPAARSCMARSTFRLAAFPYFAMTATSSSNSVRPLTFFLLSFFAPALTLNQVRIARYVNQKSCRRQIIPLCNSAGVTPGECRRALLPSSILVSD